MKTPDYLSYERYKNKKESNPNRRLFIFLTTFLATLVVFSVIAKSLSPDVDVTIGNETETEAKDTGLGVKHFIDDRLKMIQMEDTSNKQQYAVDQQNSQTTGNRMYGNQTASQQVQEEKLTLPTNTKKQNAIQQQDNVPVMPAYKAQKPNTKELSKPYESPKMIKVYVGRYSTQEQAKVAQGILLDSGVDVTPFIKNVGGTYTLQIGTFSSKAKASEISSELRGNGFPARMVQE